MPDRCRFPLALCAASSHRQLGKTALFVVASLAVVTVSVQADEPATPSFSSSTLQSLLSYDFGTLTAGDEAPLIEFAAFNLPSDQGVTSPMTLTEVSFLGDDDSLSLSTGAFVGIAPGQGDDLSLSLDTSVPGSFQVSYLLSFASDTAPSEPETLLAIAAFANVLSPADYNSDGVVDVGDYDYWKAAYGQTGGSADGNQDGVVDAADYTFWRDRLPAPEPATLQAAPEPTTLFLLALSASPLVVNRRRLP